MELSDIEEDNVSFIVCEIPHQMPPKVYIADKKKLFELARDVDGFRWNVYKTLREHLDHEEENEEPTGLVTVSYPDSDHYPIVEYKDEDDEVHLVPLKDSKNIFAEIIERHLFNGLSSHFFISMEQAKTLNDSDDFLEELKKIYNRHQVFKVADCVQKLIRSMGSHD